MFRVHTLRTYVPQPLGRFGEHPVVDQIRHGRVAGVQKSGDARTLERCERGLVCESPFVKPQVEWQWDWEAEYVCEAREST